MQFEPAPQSESNGVLDQAPLHRTSQAMKNPAGKACRAGFSVFQFEVRYFFLGGTMASFTALATRNLTTFLAGILMASPVAGLRPMRA